MLRLMWLSDENRRLRMAEMEAKRAAVGVVPEMEDEFYKDAEGMLSAQITKLTS